MSEKILAIQNAPNEHLGVFADNMEELEIPFEYAKPYKNHLPALKGYTRLIILGGPMGVYEGKRYPFLEREADYIRAAIKRSIPVLGICLGAQLMAHAFGGMVYSGRKRELGWYPVRLSAKGMEDAIFGNFNPEFQAFHWHGDTFTQPSGAVYLASSQLYKNQAFKFGRSYALQFHLEVTKEMVKEWVLDMNKKEAGEIIKATEGHIGELNVMARVFLKSWLSL